MIFWIEGYLEVREEVGRMLRRKKKDSMLYRVGFQREKRDSSIDLAGPGSFGTSPST